MSLGGVSLYEEEGDGVHLRKERFTVFEVLTDSREKDVILVKRLEINRLQEQKGDNCSSKEEIGKRLS